MDKTQSQVKPSMISVIRGCREHLYQLWHWWKAELIDMLPESFSARLQSRGRYLLAELHDSACSIRYGNRGDLAMLGQFELAQLSSEEWRRRFAEEAGKADETILLLPANFLLVRDISLPLATAGNLHNVLSFEMDRYTPFSADQVYYGYRILSRDLKSQALLVRLCLITRQRLDPLLNLFSALGMSPTVVAPAADASSALYSMNLLPKSLQGVRSGRQQFMARSRSVLILLVLAMLLFLPLKYQAQKIAELQAGIEQPRELAEQARTVNAEIEALLKSQGFLERKKAAKVSSLLLLNDLTDVLPDHTWISNVQMDGSSLRLQGESREASALIGLLDATQYLTNVRFASPVTLNARTSKERFAINADLIKEQP
ncbi:PilN domain-containing protein [Pontibacter sp. JAM-7]|uniref:PilN domain-containing protein n=1 Tax=Pontibacter sp. JAM-7 TaxID=3366581 RepID=UPI003AF643D8